MRMILDTILVFDDSRATKPVPRFIYLTTPDATIHHKLAEKQKEISNDEARQKVMLSEANFGDFDNRLKLHYSIFLALFNQYRGYDEPINSKIGIVVVWSGLAMDSTKYAILQYQDHDEFRYIFMMSMTILA